MNSTVSRVDNTRVTAAQIGDDSSSSIHQWRYVTSDLLLVRTLSQLLLEGVWLLRGSRKRVYHTSISLAVKLGELKLVLGPLKTSTRRLDEGRRCERQSEKQWH